MNEWMNEWMNNIALSYGVHVDKWSFDCFTSLCFYLMQNYAVLALILDVFGGLNLVSLSVFFLFFFGLRHLGWFYCTVATLHCCPPEAYAVWFGHVTCKNRPRYDLCVWWDVKPCSINHGPNSITDTHANTSLLTDAIFRVSYVLTMFILCGLKSLFSDCVEPLYLTQ